MGPFDLLANLQSTRSHHRVWWLSPGVVALLLWAGLLGLTAPAFGAQVHGCAPDVPPPVPGNPVPLQTLPESVLINEALSQPGSNWNCSETNRAFSQMNDSWVEFYNPQNQPINLYAAHAQLSLNDGSTSILLPFGSIIAAHGYLVLFPQEKQTVASPLPWNIILSVDGTTIDRATIPLLQPDQSDARVPDGATQWLYASNPTIGTSNNSTNQPVTPTPTKTTTATKTPTSSGAGVGVGTGQPTSSGTQPAWGQVQLPSDPAPVPSGSTTANPPAQLPGQSQNPPPPQSNSPDGGVITLLVFLSLLFLSTLVWCWRLFHAP